MWSPRDPAVAHPQPITLERDASIAFEYFPEQQTAKPESSMEDIRASLPGWRGPDGQRVNGPVEAI